MTSVVDDLERRLDNWALWSWTGHTRGRGTSSIYHQAARSRRDGETPMPIINGEAIDTDTAIYHLEADLRDALRAHYLRLAPAGYTMRTLSEIQVAAALFVSYATYRRRLIRGRAALRDALWARRHRVAA